MRYIARFTLVVAAILGLGTTSIYAAANPKVVIQIVTTIQSADLLPEPDPASTPVEAAPDPTPMPIEPPPPPPPPPVPTPAHKEFPHNPGPTGTVNGSPVEVPVPQTAVFISANCNMPCSDPNTGGIIATSPPLTVTFTANFQGGWANINPTFKWSNGETGRSIVVTYDKAGKYSVSVKATEVYQGSTYDVVNSNTIIVTVPYGRCDFRPTVVRSKLGGNDLRKLIAYVLTSILAMAVGVAAPSGASVSTAKAAATACQVQADGYYHCYNYAYIGGSQKGIYVNFPAASLSVSGTGAKSFNAPIWIKLTNNVVLEMGLCRIPTQAPCNQGNADNLVMYVDINGSPTVLWSKCCFAANGTSLTMEIVYLGSNKWLFQYAYGGGFIAATTYIAGASSSCTAQGCLVVGGEIVTANNMNGVASGTFQMHPKALATTWNSWTNPGTHVDYPCGPYPYGSCWQGSWDQTNHVWTWFFP